MAGNKKSMFRRIVKWVAGVLLAIVLIVFIVFFFFLGPAVKVAVETIAPGLTGGKVALKSVSISPLRGRVVLDDFIIYNPDSDGERFKSEYAIKLGYIVAEIDIASVFSEKIIIRELVLDNIVLNYEIASKINPADCNIKDILDNITKASDAEETATSDTEKTQDTSDSKPKRFQVDKLEMDNVSLNGYYSGQEFISIPIAITPLENIGTDPRGVSAAGLSIRIVLALLERSGVAIADAIQKGAIDIGSAIEKGVGGAIEKGVDGIRNIFK